MKIVSAKAPMSERARKVLSDPAKARKVFAAVIQDCNSQERGKVHNVEGLRFRSAPAASKART